MKASILILMFAFCYSDCRKLVPIDKNANTDFINMEGGGGNAPSAKLAPAAPVKPSSPLPMQPAPGTPKAAQSLTTPKPVAPKQEPVTPKQEPVTPKQEPATPKPVAPKPVNPSQPAAPITTPGPGSVKQLVNFYDSQGKASVIRPYSYSQAVKQG